ncbi:MAG: hypothetical protein JNM93_07525 [Bacteriovoracaceae bacterium]|nr:hypothetical protein [Bacteriovoracaceae bacterium]
MKLLAVLYLVLGSYQAYSASVFLFDFDNTVVADNAIGGTFNTPYILYPVSRPTNYFTMDKVTTEMLHKPIEISPADYWDLKQQGLLAVSDSRPGAVGKPYKLVDGREFYPGLYKIDPKMTYVNFDDVLEAFKLSEKVKPGGFKGPAFEFLQFVLSREDLAKTTGIITARPVSIEKWKEFFQYLIKKKYIKHEPNYELFRSLSNHKDQIYGQFGDSIAAKKAEAIEEIVMWTSEVYPEQTDKEIWLSNGRDKGQLNSVYYFEDEPKYLDSVVSRMEKLSSGRASNVKMGVYNVGIYPDMAFKRIEHKSGNVIIENHVFLPQYFIIDNGFKRKAVDGVIKPEEFLAEGYLSPAEIEKIQKIYQQMTCNKLLSHETVVKL